MRKRGRPRIRIWNLELRLFRAKRGGLTCALLGSRQAVPRSGALFREPRESFRGPHESFRGPHESFRGPHESFRGPHESFRGPHESFRGLLESFRGREESFRGVDALFGQFQTTDAPFPESGTPLLAIDDTPIRLFRKRFVALSDDLTACSVNGFNIPRWPQLPPLPRQFPR